MTRSFVTAPLSDGNQPVLETVMTATGLSGFGTCRGAIPAPACDHSSRTDAHLIMHIVVAMDCLCFRYKKLSPPTPE